MKLNNEDFNIRELSAKELQSINGGGEGWTWLGRVIGTIENAIESVVDGFASHDFPTTITVPH